MSLQQDALASYNTCMDQVGDSSHCEVVAQGIWADFDASDAGGFGGAMSDYWSDPTNWIDFTSGLVSIGGNIAQLIDPTAPQYNQTAAPEKDNTVLWIIGFAALLAFFVLMYLLLRKK